MTRAGATDTVSLLDGVLNSTQATTDEQQLALHLLGGLDSPDANDILERRLTQLLQQPQQVPEGWKLDLVNAAEARGTDSLRAILSQLAAARDPADPLAAYRYCLEGGDAGRGREIFFGNAAASCRRCHKVAGEGSDVGPDLSGVGLKNTREYLLESLVVPNAKIAKGFETVILVMDDGRLYTGIIKGEDETTYQLVTAQGEQIRVEKESIEERAVGKSGMPEDVLKGLSARDVRDLVEYLTTLKTPAADAAAHGEGK